MDSQNPVPVPARTGGGMPRWLIIVLVVLLILCLIPVVLFGCSTLVIAILSLLGPAIGNVFSNIVIDI